jgi:hypothetical protein
MNKRSVQQAVFESKDAIRIAKAGHKLACDELNATPRHLLSEGNPNHPMYDQKIFGYDADEFMSRQFKSAA